MSGFSSAAGRYIIKVLGYQLTLSGSHVEEFTGDDRTAKTVTDF